MEMMVKVNLPILKRRLSSKYSKRLRKKMTTVYIKILTFANSINERPQGCLSPRALIDILQLNIS